ncbi:hypothetical protein [Petrotoga sp. 9PWA.NaAc.5.4]|nr:hypothetical protein [Petrotoga sp. 9PWA.NaAc.5.4]PNR97181.1 hypothetical protein X924_00115 [Petrotoga sp. 9PWA.NaAc.5.4]
MQFFYFIGILCVDMFENVCKKNVTLEGFWLLAMITFARKI